MNRYPCVFLSVCRHHISHFKHKPFQCCLFVYIHLFFRIFVLSSLCFHLFQPDIEHCSPLVLLFAPHLSDPFWDSSAFETDTDLPSGWMRVRDTSGTYYWHIPTGTTQWEPPSPLGKVGDSTMSSTMSLETTPCEETEVRSHANFAWIGEMAREPTDNNISF